MVTSIISFAQLKPGSIHIAPDVWGYKCHTDNTNSLEGCQCTWQQTLNLNNNATGLLANMYESIFSPTNHSVFGYDGFGTFFGGVKILDLGYYPSGQAHLELYSTAGDTVIQNDATDGSLRLLDFTSGPKYKSVFRSGQLTDYRFYSTDDRSGQLALAGDGIAPTVALGPAAGAGTLVSVVGDDRSGVVTLVTGPGTTTGILFTVFFSQVFTSNVRVMVFPVSDFTAGIFSGRIWAKSSFNNHFDVRVNTISIPIPSGSTVELGYIVQK